MVWRASWILLKWLPTLLGSSSWPLATPAFNQMGWISMPEVKWCHAEKLYQFQNLPEHFLLGNSNVSTLAGIANTYSRDCL